MEPGRLPLERTNRSDGGMSMSTTRCAFRVCAFVLIVVGIGGVGAVAASADDQPLGTIFASVWFDRDRNAFRDSWEPYRVGVPVTAHNEATGQDFTVLTDGRGAAGMENLPYGDYLISAEEDGYEPVQPPTWEYTVSSPLPHSVGFPEIGSVVRGQAWDDADGDGIRQDGEPHRQVTFVLSGQSDFLGTVSRSLVSGDDGGYRF